MREPTSFDYAVIRVVPRVEREEFVNAGVIVHCRPRRFLGARISLNRDRLRAIAPELDLDETDRQLQQVLRICAGDSDGGEIATLSKPGRFHWLVAPRSTVIQVSPVHTGLSDDPEAALEHLLSTMVLTQ